MKSRTLKSIIVTCLFLVGVLALTVFLLEHFSNYKVAKVIHSDAPVITKKTITINAPIGKVWRIFSDVNNWDEWQKEIVDPVINGPFKAGTVFHWKSNGLTIASTLQSVELNKEVAWSGPAFGAFAIHTWHFTENNGQTTVSVEESMEGWLVKLLKGKFQSSLDTSIEHWLADLKTESEKEIPATATKK